MLVIFLLGFTTFKLFQINMQKGKEIQSIQAKVQNVVKEKQQIEKKMDTEYIPKTEHESEIQQKDQEIADIKASKSAQKAQISTAIATPAPKPVYYNSSHTELMRAAGIAESDFGAVEYVISHESTWNPNAINKSSGACGLGQEFPCGKSGCDLGDAVCQLRWASSYATQRYGSWWGAHSFWINNQWW